MDGEKGWFTSVYSVFENNRLSIVTVVNYSQSYMSTPSDQVVNLHVQYMSHVHVNESE